MSGKLCGLVVTAFLALAAPSLASAGDESAASAAAVPWGSLSSEQQGLLKQFEGNWDQLARQRALAQDDAGAAQAGQGALRALAAALTRSAQSDPPTLAPVPVAEPARP